MLFRDDTNYFSNITQIIFVMTQKLKMLFRDDTKIKSVIS